MKNNYNLSDVASAIGWLFGYMGTQHMGRKNAWIEHAHYKAKLVETSYKGGDGKIYQYTCKSKRHPVKMGWISFQNLVPKKLIGVTDGNLSVISSTPISSRRMSLNSCAGANIAVTTSRGIETTTTQEESYRENLEFGATTEFGASFAAPCGIGGNISVSATINKELEQTSTSSTSKTDSKSTEISIEVGDNKAVDCFIETNLVKYRKEAIIDCAVSYKIVFGIRGVCSMSWNSMDDFIRFLRCAGDNNNATNCAKRPFIRRSNKYIKGMAWNFREDNKYKRAAAAILPILKSDVIVEIPTYKIYSEVTSTNIRCKNT